MSIIKVVIADDHSLFRDGIKSLINNINGIVVVGEFDNGLDLIEGIVDIKPDVIITDISMPGMSGIDATKKISDEYPEIPVIILSMYNNEDFICNAIKAGAKSYLPKDIRRDDLLAAITAVSKGESYYSREVSETIMKNFINRAKHDQNNESEKSLTKREIEVIKLVSGGLINKEIADKLNISIRTVDAHKSNIMQKLKIKSNVEMVKYAIKNELISL